MDPHLLSLVPAFLLLLLARRSLANRCHQRFPVNVTSYNGKLLVPESTCGVTVNLDDLKYAPNVTVHGLNQKDNFTLYLLERNSSPMLGDSYKVLWELKNIKPAGNFLTTRESISHSDGIPYQGAHGGGNYTLIVYREIPGRVRMRVPLEFRDRFQTNWVTDYLEQLTQTNFTAAPPLPPLHPATSPPANPHLTRPPHPRSGKSGAGSAQPLASLPLLLWALLSYCAIQ